jgi:thiol-disulfide isomerase/thioredoxin
VRRPSRARTAGGVLVAVIALLFAIDLVRVVRAWGDLRPLGAGGAAPAFELPRIGEGGRIGPDRLALASLRGQVVVIDFWETWCRPCREAMPVVERVIGRHTDDGVALVSVCSDGTLRAAEARRLVDELAPHAALLADDGAVADRYGVASIPHLVVVGPDGTVVSVHRRFAGAAGLDRALEEAIRQALRRR